jgi:L-malate glycosyltransferase
MHIGIAGPIATEDVRELLNEDASKLPIGYQGAPLLGTLITELITRGHCVTGFTTSPGLLLSSQSTRVVKGDRFVLHYIPERPRAFRSSNGYRGRALDFFAFERRALRAAIEHARPDVIHAHWAYEFGLAAIHSDIPHVVTCHDAPQVVLRYSPNLYRFMRYLMGRHCLARAECITAVSPYLQEKLSRYARVPIHVVPNPVSAHHSAARVLRREASRSSPLLVMVNNGWGPRKNVGVAMNAFRLVRAHIPTARLRMVGTDFGPSGQAQRWAENAGLASGVEFVGRVSSAALIHLIGEADLLLHPSLEESFGMSIAEALALGKPVVGGENSGAAAWVVGSGGLTVNVRSPTAIADAALELLTNRDLYRRCSTFGATRVREEFSAEPVVSKYERIYLELGKRPRTRGKSVWPPRPAQTIGQGTSVNARSITSSGSNDTRHGSDHSH